MDLSITSSKCGDIIDRDNITLGELWNILPYVGLWTSVSCGTITDFDTPVLKETRLSGIPFAGDNTGKNPNLRLITFVAGNLQGPISTLGTGNIQSMNGPQIIFFNNLLIHRVKWLIEPLD